MTIDTDTAGIAAAMLLSFTTLGAASWAMWERTRAAHHRRDARRQEAVRWLHFRRAASVCPHLPPTAPRASRLRPSATPTGRGHGVRRSHRIQLRHVARARRRSGARR